MKARPRIVPSILSADFARLGDEVERVQKAGAESVQIDVMDGHFVPNISVGPLVVAALRARSKIYLDVHLMIENPERYVDAFAKAGASLLTVHREACANPEAVIKQIKALGVDAGVAIKPATPFSALEPLLPLLDMALVMTVEPGFGGQAFLPEMLQKVRALRKTIDQKSYACHLQVDGGINKQTAPQAAEAGADSLVAGSAIFGAPDAAKAFQELQKRVDFPTIPQVK